MKQFGIYLKTSVLAAVLVVILLIVLKNWSHRADVWFFGTYEQIPVLGLILITSITSIICGWFSSKAFRVLRDLRQVQNDKRAKRQLDEQHKLAEQNAERERRIDEKLRRSITEDV